MRRWHSPLRDHLTWTLPILFVLASQVGLGGPQILTYQGSVLRGGAPIIDGQYDMRFTIHTDAVADAQIWTETDLNVAVTGGLFATLLGDGSVFPAATFTGSQLWLEIAVDLNRDGAFETSELYAPRPRLSSAPWAVDADRLQGRAPADFAAASHQHAAPELPPRQYDAIVATSGGDFTSLTAALSAGRRTIFIRNGTYLLNAPLEITNNGVTIVGESRDGVIIDCNGWPWIRISGGGSNYTAGTISVNSGATAVTGAGTAWLANTAVGEYIRIGDSWHRIAAVAANNVLSLENAYKGQNVAGVAYNVAGYLTNLQIENLTVRNHMGALPMIEMSWALDCSVRNCRIQASSERGLSLQNAHRIVVTGCIFHSTHIGIDTDQCSNCEFSQNLCTNNTYGISVDDSASRMIISDNHCANHTEAGISVNRADGCVISGNTSSFNNTGISVSTSCTAVTVTGNTCAQNNFNGMSISNCETAAITGNTCRLNGGIGLSIWESNRCAVAGNTTTGNGGDGIRVRGGDENNIVGNISTDNGAYGIEFTFGSRDNTVGFNTLMRNRSGAGGDLVEIQTSGTRALLLQATAETPNVIGGYRSNLASPGVVGAFIGGGGRNGDINQITERYGAIAGGAHNTADAYGFVGGGVRNDASGYGAAIPGGFFNTAAGDNSLAAGLGARANHAGSFVWADNGRGGFSYFSSSKENQFAVRAHGGLLLSEDAGTTTVRVGERYRDNAIVAWGKITGGGSADEQFGLTSVQRVAAGNYEITVTASPRAASSIIPIAIAEVDGTPISAGTVRLLSVNQVAARTFRVYINNGNFTLVDNDFIFMATGR